VSAYTVSATIVDERWSIRSRQKNLRQDVRMQLDRILGYSNEDIVVYCELDIALIRSIILPVICSVLGWFNEGPSPARQDETPRIIPRRMRQKFN
jgi:hypothetical protein